jgi:hypothetical protein
MRAQDTNGLILIGGKDKSKTTEVGWVDSSSASNAVSDEWAPTHLGSRAP